MTTSSPACGAGRDQRVLDAEPGQPVGQVADRLVVGEVGLPHPALRLARRAPRKRGRPRATTVKPRVVDRRRPQHDPGRPPVAARRPAPAATSSASANDSSRRPSWVAALTGKTSQPARLAGRRSTSSASSRAVGHVDLVQRDDPRPVGRARPYAASSASIDVEVGQRVAAGLQGAQSSTCTSTRSARRAAGTPGRGPCPRWRPGSGRARRPRCSGPRPPRPRRGWAPAW